MNAPLTVGILGATGTVGQKLVSLLSGHPWFRVGVLAGSPRSRGRPFGEAVSWQESTPIPGWAREMAVSAPTPDLKCDLVFSALDAEVASMVEPEFVRAGMPVFSNARSFRMDSGVPLLIPEVNPDHVEILRSRPPGEGFIVANPNCSTTGLVLALKPLADAFDLRRVSVTSLQAISGAGYPGVPAMDILGNVIPLIPGEEEKLETEPLKILGRRVGATVVPAQIAISAQANRVPVRDGHLLSVSVGFSESVDPAAAAEVLEDFRSSLPLLGLPSAPERPVHLSRDPEYPQPRVHSELEGGMVVGVGRLKRCPVLGLRFVALVHNTIRGAAGGAILNAEFLRSRGVLSTEPDSALDFISGGTECTAWKGGRWPWSKTNPAPGILVGRSDSGLPSPWWLGTWSGPAYSSSPRLWLPSAA